MDGTGQLWILAQVALAGLLGGVIGLERELHGKPAGLRTQMLVAAAAALLVELGSLLVNTYEAAGVEQVRTDPIRIIEAVVTGISFIGAGSIIFHRGESRIEGVTTAATLLFTASIGVCVGMHQLVLAVGLTLLVLAVLITLGRLERKLPYKKGATDTPDA